MENDAPGRNTYEFSKYLWELDFQICDYAIVIGTFAHPGLSEKFAVVNGPATIEITQHCTIMGVSG